MPQHAAACRSMPQRAKIFTWRTFFLYHVETLNPLLHRCLRIGWYLSGKLLGCGLKGPGFHSRQGYFAACQFLYSDLRFFGVVLTCQVLKDTQNTKAGQVRVCSGPLGRVLGTTSACLPCLSAPTVFARETFCLPHVSPVCLYLCCHESVMCTNNMQSRVNRQPILAWARFSF